MAGSAATISGRKESSTGALTVNIQPPPKLPFSGSGRRAEISRGFSWMSRATDAPLSSNISNLKDR
jgi:hypothetical protein